MCASTLHAATTPPFLALRQVTQQYPLPGMRFWHATRYQYVVNNVTLSLNKGEHVGLVGASGAGKSTLLKILLGLETPDSGSVSCQGRAVVPASTAALRWYRQLVQYVPQDPASTLAPNKTVAQSIAEPLHFLGHGAASMSVLQRALDDVALPASLLHRRVATLSGGQAQRVAIARALALRPAFLIADEPVSGLDLPLREQITALFTQLAQQYDMGMLLVSHDISAVAALCQRVLVMHEGQIVEDRPRSALLSTPAHPHTRALLAAIPTLPDCYC
ncbi:ABC transporter ATP-binding protein [Candidatus Symbiopectobacterium sp. NZEC127]|uniref:ABC transporter ATP-binding protein n=1 Tax=Candidatus Symbiopectobacterium sp. NZEC127 TaxID=2820472 RepID=UPI002227DA5A|nr:ABC transporter ATP-binding protein [Candidatus Symbiopectobacterium sp. NZEC127]MCW2485008.1 ABC transporter ATP-binding protein [Candidatus Symbiopectobacterium sp. NZEC127]